jgi:hypothetical protein
VSFAAITLCVASQLVFVVVVVVYIVIDSVRKLVDIPSCVCVCIHTGQIRRVREIHSPHLKEMDKFTGCVIRGKEHGQLPDIHNLTSGMSKIMQVSSFFFYNR